MSTQLLERFAGVDEELLERAARAREQIFVPESTLTVSEWADRYRKLSGNAEGGQWSTDRTPYLREIMDTCGDQRRNDTVFRKPAQVGGSEVALNLIGWVMDQAPAPILVVQPTVDMAKAFSKERLGPMLRDTTRLHGKVIESGRRDSANALQFKAFPGGFCALVGSNSSSGLRSRPIKFLIGDERSAWPVSAGNEGDPWALGCMRTTTFWDAMRFQLSTPGEVGTCPITAEFELGDQRHWFVECPHCRAPQELVWKDEQNRYRLICDRDPAGEMIPETARYLCADCGCLIPEYEKARMNATGRWVAQFPGRRVASFTLESLVSPWVKWSKIVEEFLKARRSPELLRAWENNYRGLPFEEKSEKINIRLLQERTRFGGEQPEGERERVPTGAGILHAGVDVQGDRFEIVTLATGAAEETWTLAWDVILGDPGIPPDRPGSPWPLLDEYLLTPWTHEKGARMFIAACAIDAGHNSEAVHRFCEAREHRNVIPVIGRSGRGLPLLKKAAMIAEKYKRTKKQRARHSHVVGVDSAKDLLFARLKLTEPGPGYWHFAESLDPVFFDQLTATHLVTRYVGGRPVRVWEDLKDRRVEALDCTIYALAALQYLGPKVIATLGARAAELAAKNLEEQGWVRATAPASRGRRVRFKGIE